MELSKVCQVETEGHCLERLLPEERERHCWDYYHRTEIESHCLELLIPDKGFKALFRATEFGVMVNGV